MVGTPWELQKLGNLVETQKGYAFKSAWFSPVGRPIIKVSDFTDDSVDLLNVAFIEEHVASDYLKYELRMGDVVVQTVGSWPSNPASVVGKCVRVPREASGALLNQNAVKLTPSTHLDRQFLYYLLRWEDFKTYIIGTAQGAASQAAITLEAIRAYEFALPTLSVQRRIGTILATYDDLIETDKRRMRILEDMARRIYRDWFIYGNASIMWTTRAFDMGTLSQLCDLRKEPFSPLCDANRPLLDLARIPRGTIAPANTGKSDELATSRILFEPGDTLFGAIRCYLHKAVIAHFPGVTNTSVLVLRPIAPYFRALLSLIVSDKDSIRWADTHSSGTKMPVIKWSIFQEMPAPVPTRSVAERFETLVGPMIEQIGVLATRIQRLRSERDLLLPHLLSGKIDIEVA